TQEIRLRGPIPVAERLRWLVDFAKRTSGPTDSPLRHRLIGTLRTFLREGVLRREGTGEVIDVSGIPLRGEDDHKSVAEKVALLRATIRTLLREHLSK